MPMPDRWLFMLECAWVILNPKIKLFLHKVTNSWDQHKIFFFSWRCLVQMMQMIQGLWLHMSYLQPMPNLSEFWRDRLASVVHFVPVLFLWIIIQFLFGKYKKCTAIIIWQITLLQVVVLLFAWPVESWQYFKNMKRQFCWPHCILT